MSVFFIVFNHELLLFGRNLAKIFANFLFFLISVTIFFVLAQNQENQVSTVFYSITVIWFSLLSCLIFSASEFLKKDFDDGTIEQILHSVENFEIFLLAKMLANWLVVCLPILVAVFPLSFISGLNQSEATNFLTLIFLASLAINFICTFCGSLSVLGNSAPMIATIALPLIIPIVLVAHSGIVQGAEASLKILLGLDFFIAAVSVFATTKIIKIAAE